MSAAENNFSTPQWKAIVSAFPFYESTNNMATLYEARDGVTTIENVKEEFLFFIEHSLPKLDHQFSFLKNETAKYNNNNIKNDIIDIDRIKQLVSDIEINTNVTGSSSISNYKKNDCEQKEAEKDENEIALAVDALLAKWKKCLPFYIDHLLTFLYSHSSTKEDDNKEENKNKLFKLYKKKGIYPLTNSEKKLTLLQFKEHQKAQKFYNFYYNFHNVFDIEKKVKELKDRLVSFSDYCQTFSENEGQQVRQTTSVAICDNNNNINTSNNNNNIRNNCSVCQDPDGDLFYCSHCQTYKHEICGGNILSHNNNNNNENTTNFWCKACRRQANNKSNHNTADVNTNHDDNSKKKEEEQKNDSNIKDNNSLFASLLQKSKTGASYASSPSASFSVSSQSSLCSDTSEDEQLELKKLYGSRYKKYQHGKDNRALRIKKNADGSHSHNNNDFDSESSDGSLADFIVDTDDEDEYNEKLRREERINRKNKKNKNEKNKRNREDKDEGSENEEAAQKKRKKQTDTTAATLKMKNVADSDDDDEDDKIIFDNNNNNNNNNNSKSNNSYNNNNNNKNVTTNNTTATNNNVNKDSKSKKRNRRKKKLRNERKEEVKRNESVSSLSSEDSTSQLVVRGK